MIGSYYSVPGPQQRVIISTGGIHQQQTTIIHAQGQYQRRSMVLQRPPLLMNTMIQRPVEFEDVTTRGMQMMSPVTPGMGHYRSSSYNNYQAVMPQHYHHYHHHRHVGDGVQRLQLPTIESEPNALIMARSKRMGDVRATESDEESSVDDDDKEEEQVNFRDSVAALKQRHAQERGELTKKQAINRAEMDQRMTHKLRQRRDSSEPRRRLSLILGARPGSRGSAKRSKK